MCVIEFYFGRRIRTKILSYGWSTALHGCYNVESRSDGVIIYQTTPLFTMVVKTTKGFMITIQGQMNFIYFRVERSEISENKQR